MVYVGGDGICGRGWCICEGMVYVGGDGVCGRGWCV